MAKKKLKVSGDAIGAAFEDGTLDDQGALKLKGVKIKPKVSVSFATDEFTDVQLGTFTVLKSKGKVTWKYDLHNSDPIVQALGAGEQIHETYTLRISAKGYKAVTKIVTVTITGNDELNSPPVITSNGGDDSAYVRVAENATAITTVVASDADAGANLTYHIVGGIDQNLFTINQNTGVLSFLTGHTVASPADFDGDGVYEVSVNVSDGTDTDFQAITVYVGNHAPFITSNGGGDSAFVSIQENTSFVTTVFGFDPEHDPITYTLTGTDAALFHLDIATGIISFINAPDYEGPHSANYSFLNASDGELTTDQEFLVTVTNVNEAGRTVIDVATLSPSEGFVIQGQSVDSSGGSVAAADVNGDGFSDLIVGATAAGNGGGSSGNTYVIFGKGGVFGSMVSGRQVIDVNNDNPGTDGFSPADGFFVQGDALGDFSGTSVRSAGDVNGDGFEDIIIGAFGGDDGGSFAGEAYVIFGKSSGFGSVGSNGREFIDLTSLSASAGFIIQGDTGSPNNDQAGISVSSAGDINGDGFDDLMVGAHGSDDAGTNAGEAYVIFGKAGNFGSLDGANRRVVDVSNDTAGDGFAASDGFTLQGDVTNDFTGKSVSSAGDINGDGFEDVLVAASQKVFVLFGKASGGFGSNDGAGRAIIDLSNDTAGDGFNPSDGFMLLGEAFGHNFGVSASGIGDINGDGYDDIAIGAFAVPNADISSAGAGAVYVLFGKNTSFGSLSGTRQVVDVKNDSAGDGFGANEGFIIRGDAASDHAGFRVSGAGDVNGDGYADLILSAEGADDGGDGSGSAYVIFGTSLGFGVADANGRPIIDLSTLNPGQGFVIAGEGTGLGMSVSGAGDVNHDGFDDLIVGQPQNSKAYVIYGAAFGASATPVTPIGTATADKLMGALGNDTLTGNGGADVFHAGKGDDVIAAPDLSFRLADGGNGDDKLVLTGSGATFDFTTLANTKVQGIEAIDFTGTGNNTLKLGVNDALNLSEMPNFTFTGSITAPKAIILDGDTGDTLQLVGRADGTWVLKASDVNLNGTAGGSYDVWSFDVGATHLVKLAVDADIGISLL